jgi:hypothetical protein
VSFRNSRGPPSVSISHFYGHHFCEQLMHVQTQMQGKTCISTLTRIMFAIIEVVCRFLDLKLPCACRTFSQVKFISNLCTICSLSSLFRIPWFVGFTLHTRNRRIPVSSFKEIYSQIYFRQRNDTQPHKSDTTYTFRITLQNISSNWFYAMSSSSASNTSSSVCQ